MPLSPLQPLQHPLFKRHNVQVEIKRDDLIHPIISGNKWRKLKYNLKQLEQTSNNKPAFDGILSFGGSYSNHIHALAYACFQQKIPCIGIIRGEEQYKNNYTLTWARQWGMKLVFVDRKTYKRRNDEDYLKALRHQYPQYFIVPEGGSNTLALQGVSEVMDELEQQTTFDTLLTPVGSGGTMAGLILGESRNHLINKDLASQAPLQNPKRHKARHETLHRILGISVLKGAQYLNDEVNTLLKGEIDSGKVDSDNMAIPTTKASFETSQQNKIGSSGGHWQLLHQFHQGGYAKFKVEDATRIAQWNKELGVCFEPVYSGKMLLAFIDLLEQGYFKPNERIVLLHTGGLQGIGGMLERGILTADTWQLPEIR
jgi:1-aminocyclopropane-1-carboxylate deaminase